MTLETRAGSGSKRWRAPLTLIACAQGLAAAFVGLGVSASIAHAQERVRSFAIERQALPAALLEFARQAEVELFLPETPIDDVRGNSIRGALSPNRALDMLLEGTGFVGDIQNGLVRLRRVTERPRQPARRVERTRAPQISEEIVVVGSNLRGVYPAGHPVDIFSAADIAESGALRTEQFVSTLTQNLNSRIQFGAGGVSAPNGEAINGIDLRGLGVGATLVLVNGRRLPLASQGRTADISFVPLIAIERVEVLTDGASAIYGSDAIGGVVNFVLRDGGDGAETRVDYGSVTEGGLRSGSIAQAWGGEWANGSAFVSFSTERASALSRADRDFSAGAGAGDLSPHETRYGLVGALSLEASPRLQVSADLLLGQRDVKAEYEFPDIQSLVRSRARTDQGVLNLEGEYEFSNRLLASAGVQYAIHDTRIRQNTRNQAAESVVHADTQFASIDINASIDADLWSLPGGVLRLSVGAGEIEERFWSRLSDYEADRSTGYVFGELLAPIVGENQGLGWIHRLELSLAARYTRYSADAATVGDDHVSPKAGISWSPNAWLDLRASAGQSFRAPSLTDLDRSGAVNLVTALPYRGAPATVLAAFGPQPGLEAETARTYSAGFEARPQFAPGFVLRATYFDVTYDGRVANPDPTQGLAAFADPERFSDILFAPQSTVILEEILQTSTNLMNSSDVDLAAPDAASQLLSLPNLIVFDTRLRNLDRVYVNGFDVDVVYSRESPVGELDLGLRFTRTINYRERITQNARDEDVLGSVLRPADLRGRASATLTRDGYEVMAAVNYVSDYRNPYAIAGGERVESWTTWDVRVRSPLPFSGGDLSRAWLGLSVRNLFDEEPPFVASSTIDGVGLRASIGFDPANADPVGRFVAIELRRNW